jgi:16S rRNA (cytidine1402-2'-O)-methyltransferase
LNTSEKNHLPKLYLIPNFIGTEKWETHFPEYNREIIRQLKYFIAEDIKACRRLLKHAGYLDISQAIIEEYNEHHFNESVERYFSPIRLGHSIGLVSEAGCPVIADPGDAIVKFAHQKGIEVVPLVGANAILLAIMAAGLSGNNFAFNGYLPVETRQKVQKIKELEQLSFNKKQAQFFIETPYRNLALFNLLIQILHSETYLSIACDILTEHQLFQTKKVSEWRKTPAPDIHKKPCIFGLMR